MINYIDIVILFNTKWLDFKSAFDLLRGKVNELDASVTSNVKQLKELKPVSNSMVSQVRQLTGDQGKGDSYAHL